MWFDLIFTILGLSTFGDMVEVKQRGVQWSPRFKLFFCFPGPLITVPLSNRVGRKWIIMGSNVPLLLGWLLAGVATDLPTMYVARAAWGCATGMMFATVPLYIGEIAEVTLSPYYALGFDRGSTRVRFDSDPFPL